MRLKVLYLIVLISGCVMGAGFVSGSELWLFFGRYGWFALPLLLLFVCVFGSGVYKVMTLKNKYQISSIENLSILLMPKIGKYIDYVLKFSYLVFASAMLAGIRTVAGEWVCIGVLIVSFIIVFLNKKTLMRLNLFLVPIVIGFVVSLLVFNQNSIEVTNLIKPTSSVFYAIIGVIFYATVNLLLCFGALLRSYNSLTKKATFLVALVSSTILCVLAGVVLVLICSTDFNLLDLPLSGVANNSGVAFSILGDIVIVASIFTTFIACVFGVHTDKTSITRLVLLFCLIYALSLVGFYHILEIGYFAIGIFSLIYFVALMRKT